ncbi:hypothetical protein [Endobacterium cereale]|jgi:choline-glycine betaine transporter|uniref:hypothetical protein n=1 Tax=Endobacterium cereale TaxID=2663029 RepID=UPI002B480929|nr:hypothetical protein [Endobacterium cereale]MEB2843542.1 hypothetical protein [Endobacterium cereale]
MLKDILKNLQDFLLHPRQTWPYPRLVLDTIVSGLTLCMIVILTLRLFGFGDDTLFGENGMLETLQLVALGAATVVAILAAVRLRPAGRFVATTTALICLVFFLREIPSCKPDLALACVPREAHRIVPTACGLLLLLQAFLMFRTSPIALLRMMHPAFSWPLIFVGSLLFCGQLFERLHYQAFEEMIELTAYVGLFLINAWMFKSSYRVNIWHGISEMAGALLQRLQTSNNHRR